MGIKVEGHTHLIRDEESHAIINTDVEQYRLTMRRRIQILRIQRAETKKTSYRLNEYKAVQNAAGLRYNGLKELQNEFHQSPFALRIFSKFFLLNRWKCTWPNFKTNRNYKTVRKSSSARYYIK